MAKSMVPTVMVSALVGGALAWSLAAAPTGARASEPAFADTQWRVEDIAGRSVIGDGPVTLAFHEEGVFGGATGCNRLYGPYDVDGAGISIGPVGTTLMYCPPAILDQEDRLAQALEGAASWRIDGSSLYILDGDGEPLLQLTARAAIE